MRQACKTRSGTSGSGARPHFAALSHELAAESRAWRTPAPRCGSQDAQECHGRLPQHGVAPVRRDLEQRQQHEARPVHLRMRQDQLARRRPPRAVRHAGLHSRGCRCRAARAPMRGPAGGRRPLEPLDKPAAAQPGAMTASTSNDRIEIAGLPPTARPARSSRVRSTARSRCPAAASSRIARAKSCPRVPPRPWHIGPKASRIDASNAVILANDCA